MFCPKCGKELKEGAKFCASCGAQIGAASTSGGDTSTPGGAPTSGTAPAPSGTPRAGIPAPSKAGLGSARSAASAAGGAAASAMSFAKGKKPLIKVIAIAVVVVAIVVFFVQNVIFAPYAIDEEHFPDKAFRSYVSSHCDADRDGKLSRSEAAAVEYMGTWDSEDMVYRGGLDDSDIADLTGIELFPNLKGISASDNPLTDVDLSSNGALQYASLKCDSLLYVNVSGANNLQGLQVYPQTEVEGLSDSMVKNTLVDGVVSSGTGTQCTYDAYGHLCKVERDGGDSETFTWSGDEVRETSEAGSFSYDGEGRLTGASAERLAYDDKGRVAELVVKGSSSSKALTFVSYSYDDADNLTSISQGQCTGDLDSYNITDSDRAKAATTVSATYNDKGLMASATFTKDYQSFGKSLTFEYDGSGNLTKVSGDSGRTMTLEYTDGVLAKMQCSSTDSSEGFQIEYSYDADNSRLASAKYTEDGEAETTACAYTYDDNGNLSQVTTERYTDNSNESTRGRGAGYTYVDVYTPREIENYQALSSLYDQYETGSLKELCITATRGTPGFTRNSVNVPCGYPDLLKFVLDVPSAGYAEEFIVGHKLTPPLEF